MGPYIDYRRFWDEMELGVNGPCTVAIIDGENSPPEMPRFHVTYSYQATGMRKADRRDFGVVEAVSEEAAIEQFVEQERPEDRTFVRGCLTAKSV